MSNQRVNVHFGISQYLYNIEGIKIYLMQQNTTTFEIALLLKFKVYTEGWDENFIGAEQQHCKLRTISKSSQATLIPVVLHYNNYSFVWCVVLYRVSYSIVFEHTNGF